MDLLARLIAIDEIKQLKARYFRAVDTQIWDGFEQIFTGDAVFDCSEVGQVTPLGGAAIGAAGPVTEGRDAVVAWIKSAFVTRTGCHHGHCHEISIDSATEAHGVIAMTDLIRDAGRTRDLLHAAGHYWERYRFEDGRWRIAHSKLTRLFIDADPAGFAAADDVAA